MISAAVKPDPITRSGASLNPGSDRRLTSGRSKQGGGMLIENVPDARTKFLHRILGEPTRNPVENRDTSSTSMRLKIESSIPTAAGYAAR